jgi:hypothetical protein
MMMIIIIITMLGDIITRSFFPLRARSRHQTTASDCN